MNENNYDNQRQAGVNEPQNQIPQITFHSQNAFYTHTRLILVLFRNIAIAYARFLPPFIRRFIEFLFLTKAFLSLFILVYIHAILVKSPITCLDHLRDLHNSSELFDTQNLGFNCLYSEGKPICSDYEYEEFHDITRPGKLERWPRNGILRVEIVSEPVPEGYTLKDSYANEYYYSNLYAEKSHLFLAQEEEFVKRELSSSSHPSGVPTTPKGHHWFLDVLMSSRNTTCPSVPYSTTTLDFTTIDELTEKPEKLTSVPRNLRQFQDQFFLRISEVLNEAPKRFESFFNRGLFMNRYVMEYSLENGLLRLSPMMREHLNVSVKLVVLNSGRQVCFGQNLLNNFILEYLLGYNDILIGSLKRLSEFSNLRSLNKGFVRNVVENSHYRFVSMSYSRMSYLVALFAMIVFTFSVSILFRYSHHQVFVLIHDMIRMLQINVPFYIPAAPFMTLILALIAVETMMSEFFGDSLTAFYLIVIVSLADRFEAVFCHSPISKKYWPRFFLLYHFIFYAYNYRFNGQYSNMALLCSWLFTQHSMVYFFHHYDLPFLMNTVNIHSHSNVNQATQQTSPPLTEDAGNDVDSTPASHGQEESAANRPMNATGDGAEM